MNCLIIGAGKIGIDLYIKCKKMHRFENIFIFNRNKNSVGAKFCIKKNFNYSASGIEGVVNKLKLSKINVIFDASSADSSIENYKILDKYLKNNFYVNLTPSKIGDYIVPYYDLLKKIPKSINLITCGGQSSIPLILELKKVLKNIIYVELVSSIASLSAGEATRKNVENYLTNTKSAISQLSGIINNKVIINFNPSNPPVNMMNSLFFETKNKLTHLDFLNINKAIKKINKKIKIYIPQYNAKIFKTEKNNIFRITVRVIGQGDYLPAFAGNLDIITSSAAHLSKLIYEKNYN
jgi:acetaldehyde dehydrogenase